MGCCQNSINILGYKNKNSEGSSSLKGIKETNLSNGLGMDSQSYLDNVLKTLLRNKTPKLTFNKYKKIKILDRINEEESESKESSINNQKILSKEKIVDNLKKERVKNENIKLDNIKILRKNRSHPKFKTKLNEEMFIKKLNEYKENNKIKKNNYISKLNSLKESKSEQLFNNSVGDSSLKDSINKINKEKRNKKNNGNKRNNIYTKKKEKGNMTQYYEEEINRNSIQHAPRSIKKMIFKKDIIGQTIKNTDLFICLINRHNNNEEENLE